MVENGNIFSSNVKLVQAIVLSGNSKEWPTKNKLVKNNHQSVQ